MLHYNDSTFNPDRPFLPGFSDITIREALTHDQFLYVQLPLPSRETSGSILLMTSKLRHAKRRHLQARAVRFAEHPVDVNQKLERLAWMFHAGTRSRYSNEREKAEEAVDLMIDQLAHLRYKSADFSKIRHFYAEVDELFGADLDLDLRLLAENLQAEEERHLPIVTTLLAGDLDDVPDLIEKNCPSNRELTGLVNLAARMFVCWGAFELQREASLGFRQMKIETPYGAGLYGTLASTVGQALNPAKDQYNFGHYLKDLYATGQDVVDRRTLKAFEKKTREYGFPWLNRANSEAIIELFGSRARNLDVELERWSAAAEPYNARIEALLTAEDGSSRAGQRPDSLFAPISAVLRTHIVCARLYYLADLAHDAYIPDDLRNMLNAQMPDVLRDSPNGIEDAPKQRLLQLFHVARCEFLRDAGCWPKAEKKSPRKKLALELNTANYRRGHEITPECLNALNTLESDLNFSTPFGWHFGTSPRIRLSKKDSYPTGSLKHPPYRTFLLHDNFETTFRRQCTTATGCTLSLIHSPTVRFTVWREERQEEGRETRRVDKLN